MPTPRTVTETLCVFELVKDTGIKISKNLIRTGMTYQHSIKSCTYIIEQMKALRYFKFRPKSLVSQNHVQILFLS